MMDVMTELKKNGDLYVAGKLEQALQENHALWATIPSPKTETPNAYLVIEYGVALSLKMQDLEEAQRWAERAPGFAAKRHDVGEVEFLVGKVAFERGELEIAKQNFLAANAKSKGRIFHGEDKKYRQLIR